MKGVELVISDAHPGRKDAIAYDPLVRCGRTDAASLSGIATASRDALLEPDHPQRRTCLWYTLRLAFYLPGEVTRSPEGYPVYILQEDDGTRRYVVARPDGNFYCDERGVVQKPKSDESTWAGLLIGGALGALLGPWGALLGAAVGAVTGSAAEKAKNA